MKTEKKKSDPIALKPGNEDIERSEAYRQSQAEDLRLIEDWQTRSSERSLGRLIKKYEPLRRKQVRTILAGRALSPSHMHDLDQECVLAFIDAVNLFKPGHETSIATFAGQRMRNAMLRYTLDFRAPYRIGTGSSERKAYYAAQRLRAKKEAEGCRSLSDLDVEEIVQETGSSRAATKRAIASVFAVQASVDDIIEQVSTQDHSETFGREQAHAEAMRIIVECMSGLSERDRRIFEMSFLSETALSTAEISAEFGVSTERIGQIRRGLLEQMGKALTLRGLTEDVVF